MEPYPIVPGRGLATKDAMEVRLAYLDILGYDLENLSQTSLQPEDIRHNIESNIGSVEIPLGLAGPLLFRHDGSQEMVFAPAGTLEGALLASMNRGAKAVSLSGGFGAAVLHQKMVRCPMFIFSSPGESLHFKTWVEERFSQIKNTAEQHSNHAKLQSVLPVVTGESVHLKFTYTTGDAAGQNMTTICTWHAILWINDGFTADTGIKPRHFVIEGNGASDKKVSFFSIQNGRGVHVASECELPERVIEKVLRTNSDDLLLCYNHSIKIARLDGMVGYNINVANAVAAIFVATGQDLASIHESGVGMLALEKTQTGLHFSLHLPNLVIGTVGGGTHLPRQQEALALMGCRGKGKLPRLAQIIAGFALALEISTFSAIVGGQFAKAHEKLGRNKPVKWLTKSEINRDFVQSFRGGSLEGREVLSVHFPEGRIVENGVIIGLQSRVNQKLTGFVPLEMEWKNLSQPGKPETTRALLKVKPLDTEVMEGLHLMAAHIDPSLADYLYQFCEVLEYRDCHKKELAIYQLLRDKGQCCTPELFGIKTDEAREIYIVMQEWLDYGEMSVIHAENQPERWSKENIKSAIRTIAEVHDALADAVPPGIPVFEPWKAAPLYQQFARILEKEYADGPLHPLVLRLFGFMDELEVEHQKISVKKTVIHNDFNTRNVAVRQNGDICIYDWELAVQNFAQRDVVEFLSFVLPEHFDVRDAEEFLRFHFSLQQSCPDWAVWKQAGVYALKEFLVTRVSFYLTGRILLDFEFAERIFRNAFRLIDLLKK
ncbi:MAG: hypothetical protein EPGJADBJ_04697 [Saprospiraceae bacterium]|nr:hypothetical protein [Saprospiraceae bacterium]